MPACEPVSEIACVAEVVDRHRAQRAGDPLAGREQHVHLARVGRRRDLLGHRDQLVGRLAARREHGDDAVAGLALGDDAPRRALDPLGVGDRGAAELHHDRVLTDGGYEDTPGRAGSRRYTRRRPENARPSVTSSAYSRSAPTGRPLARRVTEIAGRALAQRLGDVQRRRLAGRRRVRREHDLADLRARIDRRGGRARDPQVLGVDAVDRRQRAAEHVIAAAVLVGALERDHVRGLLDDADQRGVAALVLADPAARSLREVAADLAQADPLLDVADRLRRARRRPRRTPAGCRRRAAAPCDCRRPGASRAR
jgi:hypothetical protein